MAPSFGSRRLRAHLFDAGAHRGSSRPLRAFSSLLFSFGRPTLTCPPFLSFSFWPFTDMRRDVQEIFRSTPQHKQVMMFSATLSKEIRVTCKKFMNKVPRALLPLILRLVDLVAQPLEIYVDDETKLTLHGLQQHFVKLEEAAKNRKLNDLLDNLEFNQVSLAVFLTRSPVDHPAQICIFVKSIGRATELDRLLRDCSFPSICIHSGLNQEERIKRYQQFKAFEKRILVATDIFGRGIDVERVVRRRH